MRSAKEARTETCPGCVTSGSSLATTLPARWCRIIEKAVCPTTLLLCSARAPPCRRTAISCGNSSAFLIGLPSCRNTFEAKGSNEIQRSRDAVQQRPNPGTLAQTPEGLRYLKLRSLNRRKYLEKLFAAAGIQPSTTAAKAMFKEAFETPAVNAGRLTSSFETPISGNELSVESGNRNSSANSIVCRRLTGAVCTRIAWKRQLSITT